MLFFGLDFNFNVSVILKRFPKGNLSLIFQNHDLGVLSKFRYKRCFQDIV